MVFEFEIIVEVFLVVYGNYFIVMIVVLVMVVVCEKFVFVFLICYYRCVVVVVGVVKCVYIIVVSMYNDDGLMVFFYSMKQLGFGILLI